MTLGAVETYALDIRKLRDRQIPDANGRTIPADVVRGKVHWSLRGPVNRVLIGRSEQVDLERGLSSTAACAPCCPQSYIDSWTSPGSIVGTVGGVTLIDGFQQDVDCYGTLLTPYTVYAAWSSNNASVATITTESNGKGRATAQGVGSTQLWAAWSAIVWSPGPDDCFSDWIDASCFSTCDVNPSITVVSPDYGPPEGTISITITGTGLAGATSVNFNDSNLSAGIVTSSSTQVTATVQIASAATAGDKNMSVTVAGRTSNTKTFKVRVPHHLKVEGDQFIGTPGCTSTLTRLIGLQVVDSAGNPVGRVKVKEIFNNITSNTCGSGQPSPEGCANTDDNQGHFVKTFSVGCNSVRGNCGFDLTNTWQWCPSGHPAVNLGKFTSQIRNSSITTNGYAYPNTIPAGTTIYP
ncbi:MAG: IPT/TIG domain-containing protein [Acidobacteriota bacterium]